ncbi:hypothetical protein ANN_23417 [Periplaneta americana]|uniref:Uncharacterized protein n=1 Tax=Periplaneta americana TaxID=6978 RepID=A0ABQ8SL20_PERAM|nr:hypothetical protein ANN_23417 [Periplaneta americana]
MVSRETLRRYATRRSETNTNGTEFDSSLPCCLKVTTLMGATVNSVCSCHYYNVNIKKQHPFDLSHRSTRLDRCLSRTDLVLQKIYMLSRAVASWSKVSCVGLSLRNERWFESSQCMGPVPTQHHDALGEQRACCPRTTSRSDKCACFDITAINYTVFSNQPLNNAISTAGLFSVDGISDSEIIFGELRPRIRHTLPDIRLTVGEHLGKAPIRFILKYFRFRSRCRFCSRFIVDQPLQSHMTYDLSSKTYRSKHCVDSKADVFYKLNEQRRSPRKLTS